MPVIVSSAYVSVETVALLIRAISNDMINGPAGELLTDSSPYLFPLLNDSLEWFQNELANHGEDSFVKETYLTSITPVGVNDPGVQVFIDDTGYFDGVVAHASPQVPDDLMVPEFMWERVSGSTEVWVPMRQVIGGLPSQPQGQRLGIWEWRQGSIYMPGATQTNDLRIRYKGSLATLATVNDILYFRNAAGAIAYYMLSSWLVDRNPEAAVLCEKRAMSRLQQLATRNARMKQRVGVSRQSYGASPSTRRFIPPRN